MQSFVCRVLSTTQGICPLMPNTVLPASPSACTYPALPPAAGMEIWRKETSWLLVEPGPLRKQTPRNGASFHPTCCTFLSLKLRVYSADGSVLPQGSTVEPNMPGKGSLSLMSPSKPLHMYLSSCHFLNWQDFLGVQTLLTFSEHQQQQKQIKKPILT